MFDKGTLKQFILHKLGSSMTDVELTDTDLDMIIFETINYYNEYSSDGYNEVWYSLPLKVADGNLQKVPDDIDFILYVNTSAGAMGAKIIPFTYGLSTELALLGQVVKNNQNQSISEAVVSRIIYKDGKRFFQIDPAPVADTKIAAKVLTYKDLSQTYMNPWVLSYATATAKFLLGLIRSKYSTMTAPSDSSMNGNDLISQAQQELTDLKQQLFDMDVLYAGGVVMG